MGHIKLEEALQALRQAGLRARRGYPGKGLPALTGPVAALWLHKLTAEETVVAVRIFCPTALGGDTCEDTALQALDALQTIGADCQQSACGYDKETGCFCAEVLAGWRSVDADGQPVPEQTPLQCQVRIGGSLLPYVTGFSAEARRELAPQTGLCAGVTAVRAEQKCWVLTLEELLPHGATQPAEEAFGFALSVKRSDCTETYANCYWESCKRQEVSGGVKQVRTAKSWAERSVLHGEYEL